MQSKAEHFHCTYIQRQVRSYAPLGLAYKHMQPCEAQPISVCLQGHAANSSQKLYGQQTSSPSPQQAKKEACYCGSRWLAVSPSQKLKHVQAVNIPQTESRTSMHINALLSAQCQSTQHPKTVG